MATKCDYSYDGRGKLFVAPVDNNGTLAGGYMFLGNASALNIKGSIDTKKLADSTTTAGGSCATSETITSVMYEATLTSMHPDTLDIIIGGASTYSDVATVVGEVHKAYKGCIIPLSKIPDASTITVTGKTEGTDYQKTPSGVQVLVTTVEGEEWSIDYTSVKSTVTEALVNTGKNWAVFFEGMNNANGKRVNNYGHFVKFPPSEDLAKLIGSDFAEFSLTGEAKRKPGAYSQDISAYFTLDQELPE